MKNTRLALFCLGVCLLLSGCVRKQGVDGGTIASNTLTPSTHAKNVDQTLDVVEITMDELLLDNHSYLLMTQQGECTLLYRFFIEQQGMVAYVECYKMESITQEFFGGGAVDVVSAHRNSMNYADWQIVNTRFCLLKESGITVSKEQLTQQSGNGFFCILGGSTADALDLSTLNCGESIAAEGEDQGLLCLLRTIYDTRGTGVQLCGPGK